MADFSHLVIGAGVVGLAVSARLARHRTASVLLVERHNAIGTETSARNSEVIHAGLYYPPDSLKTRLCIRGKHLLYQTAAEAGIAHRKCGKWIIAQNENEHEYLENLHDKAKTLGISTEFIPLSRVKDIEPSVLARSAVLNSPTTGIVSAHELMAYLHGQFESHSGDLALGTAVTRIEYDASRKLYNVRFRTITAASQQHDSDEMELKFENVVNCAGLSAPAVSNLLLPQHRHVMPFYAKGSYFSYGSSKPKTERLIYPCPTGHAGLGTHLTLDLAGRIRFGPNVEWVDSPANLAPSGNQLDQVYEAVIKYLPGVDKSALSADYAGIRPKITGPEHNAFTDFVIQMEQGFPGFVNLLGIESPGLTSSLAIGEYVENLYYKSS
ncbi:putative FAD-dependent oxidoreductase [Lipomyces japonicus]|uniref:putative FAD-dependent oxidoreductase n=1 Tax=Lipomyces japonicus TaxID=56871 RepID=UPI0034CFA633